MTRRIQPPDYPTTGHPYVDNALRNAWREHRDYLVKMSVYDRYWATFYGNYYPVKKGYFIVPTVEGPRTPRKLKKAFAKQALSPAFTYYEPDYYTPKRLMLGVLNQNQINNKEEN